MESLKKLEELSQRVQGLIDQLDGTSELIQEINEAVAKKEKLITERDIRDKKIFLLVTIFFSSTPCLKCGLVPNDLNQNWRYIGEYSLFQQKFFIQRTCPRCSYTQKARIRNTEFLNLLTNSTF